MPPIDTDNLAVYEGAIAMTREGNVGIVMGIEGKKLAVDGEATALDDLRLVPEEASEEAILALAIDLGISDSDSLSAMVECVRLLREKRAMKLGVPQVKTFVPPTAKVTEENHKTAEPAEDAVPAPEISAINPQAIIDSLRTEVAILERDLAKAKATASPNEEFEALRKQLDVEKKGREKAEYALVETDLELRTLKNNLRPVTATIGGHKPIECKILLDTKASDFEKLWAEGWECWQAEFSALDKCRTVWRKENQVPDGNPSPLREEVTLPTFFQNLQRGAFDLDETLPVFEGEEELAFVQNELRSEVIEIAAADLFPRFDNPALVLGPIGESLVRNGLEATKSALNQMDAVAFSMAMNAHPQSQLLNREIQRFGEKEKV